MIIFREFECMFTTAAWKWQMNMLMNPFAKGFSASLSILILPNFFKKKNFFCLYLGVIFVHYKAFICPIISIGKLFDSKDRFSTSTSSECAVVCMCVCSTYIPRILSDLKAKMPIENFAGQFKVIIQFNRFENWRTVADANGISERKSKYTIRMV